jgi:hypothetical protein
MACLGVGVNFGGITRPSPAFQLANHLVGLARRFIAYALRPSQRMQAAMLIN